MEPQVKKHFVSLKALSPVDAVQAGALPWQLVVFSFAQAGLNGADTSSFSGWI
ncbi:MAG: hypothetical protein ACLQVY_05905 [Limisphaerales bacterium]